MIRFGLRSAVMILASFLLAKSAPAGDWPGWRGPTGLGYTDEKDLPLTWNGKTGQNILWKTAIRGGGAPGQTGFGSPGHSCPIVWRDRVFITTAVWPAGATLTAKLRRFVDFLVARFATPPWKLEPPLRTLKS